MLILLFACVGTEETATPRETASPPQDPWALVELGETGSLSGVWGSGPDDVWIVGGDEVAGQALHFDGQSWEGTALPEGTPLLVWVHGFGPSDVLAVGVDGAVVHWDGQAWSALDSGTEQDLWGVWGAGPDEVWIVGGDADVGDPLILRYDGQDFTETPLDPQENDRGATTVFKVWGVGDEVFIVGQRGLILRLDDQGAWRRVSGGAQANVDLIALWGSGPEHIVAVGGRSNARVSTWDGSAWDTVAPSGVGGLNAVHVEPDGSTFVGGITGTVGRWEDGALQREGEFLTTIDLHAMWGDDQGHVWAVGGNFLEPHQGVALVRTEP